MAKISMKSGLMGIITFAGVLFVLIKIAQAITAFTPQNQPVGYVAQNEVSSFSLNSGTEILFRPEYQRGNWSGNLYAYPINTAGVANIAAEWWSGGAAGHIDGQDYNTVRLIATMKDNGTGIPFRYTNLSVTQQGYLGSSAVLDFLRGNRIGEGSTFRQRETVLGDIIHSRPFYIADASNPTIFVGANDGMLHAINAGINASGGEERWAYVPSMLLSKMASLSSSSYVHDYFVDGQINISTILSDSKRILVGALGAGGKGLYALNITGSSGLTASTETAVASKVMWEITPSQVNYANPATTNAYINLGFTYGTPTIAKVSGTDAVIIGNGYNNNATGDYQAYLYVINADTGQRISAIKAGTSGTAASPNGLSTPVAIDSNSDGSLDIAYAGDLNGTLWKFDLFTGTSTALYNTSPAQPITSTPAVASHPSGGYIINFATGAMLTTADTTDASVHYVYGVWDGATGTNMVTQTLTERVFGSERVRRVTANAMNWSSDKGWKVALPKSGEKVVGEGSYILNGRFFFSTHNPTVSIVVAGTSTTVKGENWLMELDFLSGGTKNLPFLDLNVDSLIDDKDRIKYITSDTKPGVAVDGDPIMTTDGIPVGNFVTNGVMSQPILVQLNTLNNPLFNSNPDITLPNVSIEGGVIGGHFDVDIFYGTGIDPTPGDTCTASCLTKKHVHEYDDKYNTTGVNYLDANNADFDLSKAIPLTSTPFKVLAQNQYLSPAVSLHIGDSSYTYNVNAGYVAFKNYQTSATLSLASVPTYTRATVGSLAINMPSDALSQKDWWGGVNGLPADIRVGLHPTQTGCVKQSKGATDGNMYQPVNPPLGVTANGNGTLGYSASTTQDTATGVRHNGALTVQIISASTPDSDIELSVVGRPEYGWRVKASKYSQRVLAEYTTFWHKSSGACYGLAGWTKLYVIDPPCGPAPAKACSLPQSSVGTDPKIGGFGTGAALVSTTKTVVGNVTTITYTYADGSTVVIVKTKNSNGTLTTSITDFKGTTTTTDADTSGRLEDVKLEEGNNPVTGRVSWRELVRP